jgi:hypothetical protein
MHALGLRQNGLTIGIVDEVIERWKACSAMPLNDSQKKERKDFVKDVRATQERCVLAFASAGGARRMTLLEVWMVLVLANTRSDWSVCTSTGLSGSRKRSRRTTGLRTSRTR